MWLVDLVWAGVQEWIPKHRITLCSIPWHFISCGPGPLFFERLCSRSGQAGGTALLVHSWVFFFSSEFQAVLQHRRGDTVGLGRHSPLGFLTNAPQSIWSPSPGGEVCMGPAPCCCRAVVPVEAGVQHSPFHGRKRLYFCVCRSGWTDAAAVLGKSGSGDNIEAWCTVEGMSDWYIDVAMSHKVDTKQELAAVD